MSRVGKKPIVVPQGVEVSFANQSVTVKGPKGTLTLDNIRPGIVLVQEDGQLTINDETGDKLRGSAFRGLYRALVANMVQGTTEGFKIVQEFIGVGYRCAVEGRRLKIEVGYSMPKYLDLPEGVNAQVDKNTILTLTGPDKHVLGQFAAYIRRLRPPEPYKGKGIKFQGEIIRRKAGKSAAGAK